MTSLWDAVGPEIDAEHAALRMTRAKVACASLWPFLARAEGNREFEHRLALAEEHIAARVEDDLLDAVTASLRTDFLALEKTAVEAEDNKGAGNPWYFSGGEEHGPATGDTNQFPPHPTGSDPMDPINMQYPAQPQPWTVPPGGEWKENPMQFGGARKTAEIGDTDTCRTCGEATRYVTGDGQKYWSHSGSDGWQWDDHHVPHPQRYPHEGSLDSGRRLPFEKQATDGVVPTPGPNPHFFDGGTEGIAGEQSGFPADISEAPEDWANSYGVTAAVETVERDAPDSNDNAGTQFDSDAERDRYREGQEKTGHRFYDPMDPGLRMTAAEDPFGGDNPYAQQGASVGGTPPTPPSLEGGPGSVAQEANGGVPQSTKPRQMPGGGMPAEEVPNGTGGNSPTLASLSFAAFMKHAESQELFSEENPSGLRDPFQETQFERARAARPRMEMDHMHINTPQNPQAREPIRTVNSDPSGAREDDAEEER